MTSAPPLDTLSTQARLPPRPASPAAQGNLPPRPASPAAGPMGARMPAPPGARPGSPRPGQQRPAPPPGAMDAAAAENDRLRRALEEKMRAKQARMGGNGKH